MPFRIFHIWGHGRSLVKRGQTTKMVFKVSLSSSRPKTVKFLFSLVAFDTMNSPAT
ncbi:hypothetical protein TPY_1327 [Sulfobacillus acidophilus TPY]|nr:hypothetical protein TPY_1327 [Sulfobacillus acidophilus TPY]